jgi:TPR repeat protein
MYRLAQIYNLGKNVNRDYQKAYDLYSRAAELEHNEATRILDITHLSIGGFYTENSKGAAIIHPDELDNTLSTIEFIAKQGKKHFQHQLGTFYMASKSHLNYNKAFEWYHMAASNGNIDALYQLGLLHETEKELH